MAITLINVAKLASSGAATTIAAPATNHTAKNLLFVFARHGTDSTSTISISDTVGNTFTPVDALIGNAAAGAAQAFYAKNILGNASNVVTATFGASVSFRGITVLQYSGLDTVSPLDAHITGNGTFTTAIVSGTFSRFVVARIKTTRGGGSSIVLSKALKAGVESMWTSSMMNILWRSRAGAIVIELMMTSRTFSTPVFDAASISSTSIDREATISLQESQRPQGSADTPSAQFSAFAKMRAVVVFPTPRAPVKT